MSTTINPILLDHHWKDDGTNFYRLLLIHNRKKKYLKTNIAVTKDDLGRGGKVKTLSIKTAIDDVVLRFRKYLSDINMFDLDAMSIDEVVKYIEIKEKSPEKFELDFYSYGLEVAKKKSASTSAYYVTALNALLRFFQGRHPNISEITVRNLRAFEDFLRTEGLMTMNRHNSKIKESEIKKKRGATFFTYISKLRHIYHCAQMQYNDPDLGIFHIPNNPFEYYSVPKCPASKHRNVSVATIQKMIDTRKSLKREQRLAIDVFLISFGLCGMNLADMFVCSMPDKDGILRYNRRKTTSRRGDGAEMRVKIFPCIREIIQEYMDDERCFSFHRRFYATKSLNKGVNKGLRQWQEDNKEEDFTFYAARHSWATIARSKLCNIDAKVVTAGLCHVDANNKTDDVYIQFDWEQLWDAQKKILDVFKW